MNNYLQDIYSSHHSKNRPENFSILEEERSFLLKEYIGKGKNVLDIGCRDGNLTKHFVSGNTVTGVDIDSNSLLKAKEKLNIETLIVDLNGEWEELKDKKFDVVVAGEILEHLYYPESVIKKVLNHLNDGGIFIGSIPNAFSLKHRMRYLFGTKKFTPLSDPTHINHFEYKEFKKLLYKYFNDVEIIGLGRYKLLSKIFTSFVSFDFFFVCKK
ncbi:MAG: class I SAM-dependent methyltransferase [Candidatus Paceibacterota bacterium]